VEKIWFSLDADNILQVIINPQPGWVKFSTFSLCRPISHVTMIQQTKIVSLSHHVATSYFS